MVEPLLFGDALRLYLETMETTETPETPVTLETTETLDEGEVDTPESIQPKLHEALNLSCPSCGVFCDPDPDGCIAMECLSCDVAFCWLCFQACGRDAHPHCREVHGGYFPSRSDINRWHRRLRWRQVDGVLQRSFGGRRLPEREEALRLCERNLADSKIGLWPFPAVAPSVLGTLVVAPHVQAAQFGWIDELRALLDETPELMDQADDRGMTALMAAAHGGHAAVVTMLLERRADVTSRDDRGVSALEYAIREDRQEVVLAILDHARQEVNSVGPHGSTALLVACECGREAIARELLDRGAKVDALKNRLEIGSATMLAKIGTEKGIMLFGIEGDQKEANFQAQNLGPADAILISSDLVTGSLTKMSLAENNLDEEATKAICEALEQNKTLKELDINGSGLRGNIGGLAGAKHVAKMLGVNGSLTSINLSQNNLTNFGSDMTGVTELAAALGVNGSLTKMSLAENKLEEEGTKAICEALEQNKTLKELDISGGDSGSNIGGLAGAKHVAKMLGVNGSLTSIKLRGNTLKKKGWGAIFAAICGNKDSKIMSMDASNEDIGPAGAKLIAEALRTSVTGSLTSINLSNNVLCEIPITNRYGGGTYTAEGIIAIADALRVNGSLTSINLSGNQLCGLWTDWKGDLLGTYTAEGIAAIADALRVNGSLTVTNLLGNWLDAESAKMLAEVAKRKGISLCGIQRDQTTADFSNQNLEPRDAILLALDLSQAGVTGSLTKMSLAENKLEEKGTKAICKALEKNKTLKELDISGSNIGGKAGAKHVAKMLGVNGSLTKMRLEGNSLDEQAKRALRKAWRGAPSHLEL